MKYTSSQSGFTLVELAIVLMIIGLLIGGILKGQELINNARITSTMRQVKSYQAAFITFQDSYSALPGDIANATTRIPNCTAGNFCSNGDGSGKVGTSLTYLWSPFSTAIASENTQFWKHLALTNLISGVSPSSSTIALGETFPSTINNSGFFPAYADHVDPEYLSKGGHHIILRKNTNGTWECGSGTCALTPITASQIDRKMDDGIALAGSVVSMSNGNEAGCGISNQGINGADGYTNRTTELCDMFFEM
jgi:prepilin-type N-terminal cleavage/methylation domain-containing protein